MQNKAKIEYDSLLDRLVNLDNTRITKHIFLWDYKLNANNWSSEIQQIQMIILLKTNAFDNQAIVNWDLLTKNAFDDEQNNWRNKCEITPKLRTYVTFKNLLRKEEYVSCNLSRLERSYLAQIRLGILPINIEVGRFRGIQP